MSTAEETVTAPDEERLEGADDFAGAAADSDPQGAGDAGSASARDRYDAEEITGAESGIPDTVPARIPPVRATGPRMPLPEDEDEGFVPTRRGRGGYDPEADAIARAARYTFRQRAVVALILGTVLCGGLAVAVAPLFWWGCGGTALSLVTYLAYLRKQVRIEQEIRRRRSARLAGRAQSAAAPGFDAAEAAPRAARPGMDRDTARALRRRSHLLELDDEDPVFEHLEPYDAGAARTVRNRATGGEIRRAAGA